MSTLEDRRYDARMDAQYEHEERRYKTAIAGLGRRYGSDVEAALYFAFEKLTRDQVLAFTQRVEGEW